MNILDRRKGKSVALSFTLRATIVLRELQTEAADVFSIPAASSMNIAQIVEIVKAVEIVERL
jgi:hypothetical protein